MTTTASTWFYATPEKHPYYLSERVNTTFWEARFGDLLLNVVRAEPPFLMEGNYLGARVKLEWEPNKWLRLSLNPANPTLANGVANILRRKAAIRYENADGETVWEWWIDGADRRWQEIQGQPAYRQPQRLGQEE